MRDQAKPQYSFSSKASRPLQINKNFRKCRTYSEDRTIISPVIENQFSEMLREEFIQKIQYGSNVLICGRESELFIDQICRKANRVVWLLSQSKEYPNIKEGNLMILEGKAHKNMTKGDFRRLFQDHGQKMSQPVDYFYLNIEEMGTFEGKKTLVSPVFNDYG